MNPKKNLLLPVLAIAVLAASTVLTLAQTEVLTFDNLPAPLSNGNSLVPNGYGGLQWQNFGYLNVGNFTASPAGYNNANVSGTNVAFNANSGSAQISGTVFNLNSAYLTGAWRDGLQVEVEGFVGTTLTYDNTYTVNTSGPDLINFNYLGVDQVIFNSSGGTLDPAYHDPVLHALTEEFAMDNLSITMPAPEPSTIALLGLAGLLLAFRYRPRRCRS